MWLEYLARTMKIVQKSLLVVDANIKTMPQKRRN